MEKIFILVAYDQDLRTVTESLKLTWSRIVRFHIWFYCLRQYVFNTHGLVL